MLSIEKSPEWMEIGVIVAVDDSLLPRASDMFDGAVFFDQCCHLLGTPPGIVDVAHDSMESPLPVLSTYGEATLAHPGCNSCPNGTYDSSRKVHLVQVSLSFPEYKSEDSPTSFAQLIHPLHCNSNHLRFYSPPISLYPPCIHASSYADNCAIAQSQVQLPLRD